MLHLDMSALPFSLFLYHTSIDASLEPDIYVMTHAWYGVVPTGAQAAVAIKMLTELSGDAHPGAVEVLSKDIYVDDVNPVLKLRLLGTNRSPQLNRKVDLASNM